MRGGPSFKPDHTASDVLPFFTSTSKEPRRPTKDDTLAEGNASSMLSIAFFAFRLYTCQDLQCSTTICRPSYPSFSLSNAELLAAVVPTCFTLSLLGDLLLFVVDRTMETNGIRWSHTMLDGEGLSPAASFHGRRNFRSLFRNVVRAKRLDGVMICGSNMFVIVLML